MRCILNPPAAAPTLPPQRTRCKVMVVMLLLLLVLKGRGVGVGARRGVGTVLQGMGGGACAGISGIQGRGPLTRGLQVEGTQVLGGGRAQPTGAGACRGRAMEGSKLRVHRSKEAGVRSLRVQVRVCDKRGQAMEGSKLREH
eukprot:1144704-Pelagomonas_calceolata.AAC.1